MNLRLLVKNNAFLIIICVLFLISSILLSLQHQYMLNPDATSYFTIAREYATGNLKDAINSYWGPLLSLLLVPAVWLNFDLIITSRVLTAVIGSAILVVVYAFLRSRSVSKPIAAVSIIPLSLILLPWGVYEAITPDILFAFILLLLAVQLLRFLKAPTLKNIILLSIIGNLLYATKGFGLYLFIAVIGLTGLYQLISQRKQFVVTLKKYLLLALFFGLLVSPFITAISIKSGSLTINNGGDFNQRLLGPAQKGAYPNAYLGPLVPENDLAISAWETPEVYTETMEKWNIFGTNQNFSYYIDSILTPNLNTIIKAIYGFGPFVVIGLVCLLIGGLRRSRVQADFLAMGIITAIMLAGYSLVYSEQRYLIGLAVFSVIALAITLSIAVNKKMLSRLQIIALVTLSCIPLLMNITQTLTTSKDSGRFQYEISQVFKSDLTERENIISNDFSSYSVCYFANLRCYGVINPGTDPSNYLKILKDLNVRYYLQYDNIPLTESQQSFIRQYATPSSVFTDPVNPATLYTLNSI